MNQKISIITPTYNRPDMLPRAIESVLAQTYTDWEMIIVDDCPEKPAEAIVARYKDPRITYIKHEKNKGGAEARNTAMKLSTGAYFCFIDDDDEWYPNVLEILYNGIKDTPTDIGFCFAAIEMQYPDGKKVFTHVPEGVADYHERALRDFHGFIGQTLIVKRAVYEDVGGWDPTYPSHQEIEWVIRFTKKYKGIGIDKPVVRFYVADGHERIGNSLPKRVRGRELLLERYRSEFETYPDIYAKHLFLMALWCRAMGQYAKARRILGQVLGIRFSLRTLFHYATLTLWGAPYRILSYLGILKDPNLL